MQKYKVRTYRYNGEELRVGGTIMNNAKVLKTIRNLVIERFGNFEADKLEYLGERKYEVTKQMVNSIVGE